MKYEDLLTLPISTLGEVYNGLGLEFDHTAGDSILNHTRAPPTDKDFAIDHFSTYRYAETYLCTHQRDFSSYKCFRFQAF